MMLGLGAGIDYSLLIIARYREQVAAGDSVRDASAKSAATAGASVVAAGLIVMVAIAGLLVVGIPFVGKMGIGAAIGVAAVVVSALTLLPILIGAFARWLKPKRPEHVRPSAAFERWGTLVTARPWLSIGAGVARPAALRRAHDRAAARPARRRQPARGRRPSAQAYDLQTEAFGPGSNGPFLLAVDIPKGDAADGGAAGPAAAAPSARDRRRRPGHAAAAERGRRDGDDRGDPEVLAAGQAHERPARPPARRRHPGGDRGHAAEGLRRRQHARRSRTSPTRSPSRLPLFIAVVIGLSVLLLMAAFRSLWIPLVSAVFNLLSVGAAYGVVTAVFQEGIGASLIGVDSGVPIMSFVPVMIFAILFGLSMDYNVFLLSRIHEAYNEGDAPRESVIHGMARIGKVVLFAGLIMAAVFLGFIATPDVISKMMGLGLGLAILIDVLIVRLVIAPAVVTLLGDKAWWLPGWLDRLLPDVSLEGHLVENLDPRQEPVEPPRARVAGLAPAGAEEVDDHRPGLVGQQAADDLGAVVELRVVQDVHDAPRRAGLRVGRGVDHARDPGEHDRSRAHRARLQGHVERRVEDPPRADRGRRLAKGEHLGVGGRVLEQLALVVPDSDDLLVLDDDRPDGHVVVLERLLGLGATRAA